MPLGEILPTASRFGLYIAFTFSVALFSYLRPDSFFSTTNLTAILTLAAPLVIASLGLTVALVVNEIDLSLGSMIGLGGAMAVVLMSFCALDWKLAILCALAIAVIAGSATGAIVSFVGANSLIISLGMATVLTGMEFTLTDQRTIYEGVQSGYVALGQASFCGINLQVWIAAGLALITYVILERTEIGRYMYAAGNNREAAFLAGVPVSALRIAGFVASSVSGAIAGILLSAQSASAFSNAGQPYLLPAYAAAFLGSTVSRDGRFSAVGTVAAVLFIGVVQTGLTMLQLSTGSINLAQGLMLIAAVLLSLVGRRRRAA